MHINLTSLKKNKTFSYIILGILIFGLAIAVYLVQKSQELRKKAVAPAGPAAVILSPGTTTLPINYDNYIDVNVNTIDRSIDGVQIFAKIGPIPQDAGFIAEFSPQAPAEMQSIVNTIETHPDDPNFLLAKLVFITVDPLTPYATNGQETKFGSFKFNSNTEITITVELDTIINPFIESLSKITENQTTNDILLAPQSATYTFSSTATATPSPSPTPSPTPTCIPAPEICNQYNSILECLQANPTLDEPQEGWCPPTQLITSFAILTKFNGVTSDVGPITATLNVGQTGSSTPLETQTVDFTYQSSDTYQATITTTSGNLLEGSTFWIALKGEKHLQRVFKDIALTNDIALDLTSKPQEPGDLPAQDGQVDTNDLDRLTAIWSNITQTQQDLDVADVNYDGKVNAMDLNWVLVTLSVKPEEPF